jgi:protein SCO1/2
MTLLLSLLLACAPEPEPSVAADPVAELDPTPVATGPSLYELSVPLVRADGTTTGLDVHRGHPALVSMFYATCPSACPMLVQNVKAFEDGLEPEARQDLRVLLMSLDPERDDPAALTEAAERYAVDPERWVLAVPPADRVRELAALLGLQYRPAAEGEIHHTSVLVLLDGEGRPIARSTGPNADTSALREALLRL